jgi:hypothetical protein
MDQANLAFLCLGIALPASNAVGQQKTLKELIVGTWLLDSVYELNITTTQPIPDPKMGPFVPHINFKRAK